jgi:hypothetical protein
LPPVLRERLAQQAMPWASVSAKRSSSVRSTRSTCRRPFAQLRVGRAHHFLDQRRDQLEEERLADAELCPWRIARRMIRRST